MDRGDSRVSFSWELNSIFNSLNLLNAEHWQTFGFPKSYGDRANKRNVFTHSHFTKEVLKMWGKLSVKSSAFCVSEMDGESHNQNQSVHFWASGKQCCCTFKGDESGHSFLCGPNTVFPISRTILCSRLEGSEGWKRTTQKIQWQCCPWVLQSSCHFHLPQGTRCATWSLFVIFVCCQWSKNIFTAAKRDRRKWIWLGIFWVVYIYMWFFFTEEKTVSDSCELPGGSISFFRASRILLTGHAACGVSGKLWNPTHQAGRNSFRPVIFQSNLETCNLSTFSSVSICFQLWKDFWKQGLKGFREFRHGWLCNIWILLRANSSVCELWSVLFQTGFRTQNSTFCGHSFCLFIAVLCNVISLEAQKQSCLFAWLFVFEEQFHTESAQRVQRRRDNHFTWTRDFAR